MDVAAQVPELDLIVGGHSHTFLWGAGPPERGPLLSEFRVGLELGPARHNRHDPGILASGSITKPVPACKDATHRRTAPAALPRRPLGRDLWRAVDGGLPDYRHWALGQAGPCGAGGLLEQVSGRVGGRAGARVAVVDTAVAIRRCAGSSLHVVSEASCFHFFPAQQVHRLAEPHL
jgi:hypothetical protein